MSVHWWLVSFIWHLPIALNPHFYELPKNYSCFKDTWPLRPENDWKHDFHAVSWLPYTNLLKYSVQHGRTSRTMSISRRRGHVPLRIFFSRQTVGSDSTSTHSYTSVYGVAWSCSVLPIVLCFSPNLFWSKPHVDYVAPLLDRTQFFFTFWNREPVCQLVMCFFTQISVELLWKSRVFMDKLVVELWN